MGTGGVCVGEASHLGPSGRRRRRVRSLSAQSSQSGSDPTLLDDLETGSRTRTLKLTCHLMMSL